MDAQDTAKSQADPVLPMPIVDMKEELTANSSLLVCFLLLLSPIGLLRG